MQPLRILRRLLPRRVRRRLLRMLPAPVRAAVARRLRAPALIDLARVDPAASPLSARTGNLDRVVAALEAAGVPYFRVPVTRCQKAAVGVPEPHRARVRQILADLALDGARSRPVGPAPTGAEPAPAPTGAEPAPPPEVIAVYWPVTDPARRLLLGADVACEIEFWREMPDRLVAPRSGPSTDVVLHDEPEVAAADGAFGDFHGPDDGRRYRTRRSLTVPPIDHVDFPIDVVYTWVDGADPAWQARKNAALADNGWAARAAQTANDSRYLSHDELRYSLRSLHCHAPWVRHIFLVTDDQVPHWLDVSHPQLTLVSHKEILGDIATLPTFNSMAVETRLHRIPGLSEHFLYFNDDVFLGRPVLPSLFFTPAGQTKVFLSGNRVDGGPASPDDLPIMAAGKNNRALIEGEFGRFLARKLRHTPHPARRSVLGEIESRYPGEIARTASHQFRHHTDISLVSSLQQHWALLSGRAVPGNLRYLYVDIADPATPDRLAEAQRRRHLDVFCLNDTDSGAVPIERQLALVSGFLSAYFPFRSPYERPDPS